MRTEVTLPSVFSFSPQAHVYCEGSDVYDVMLNQVTGEAVLRMGIFFLVVTDDRVPMPRSLILRSLCQPYISPLPGAITGTRA